ncbi:MAG: hypothetical protein OQK82_03990 [Candidatus Pacearchaeota archaeon]|nr:hypothetical protein [Candidatus Pacearchaeota archaeon]
METQTEKFDPVETLKRFREKLDERINELSLIILPQGERGELDELIAELKLSAQAIQFWILAEEGKIPIVEEYLVDSLYERLERKVEEICERALDFN